jgi:hypothetical protein
MNWNYNGSMEYNATIRVEESMLKNLYGMQLIGRALRKWG